MGLWDRICGRTTNDAAAASEEVQVVDLGEGKVSVTGTVRGKQFDKTQMLRADLIQYGISPPQAPSTQIEVRLDNIDDLAQLAEELPQAQLLDEAPPQYETYLLGHGFERMGLESRYFKAETNTLVSVDNGKMMIANGLRYKSNPGKGKEVVASISETVKTPDPEYKVNGFYHTDFVSDHVYCHMAVHKMDSLDQNGLDPILQKEIELAEGRVAAVRNGILKLANVEPKLEYENLRSAIGRYIQTKVKKPTLGEQLT
jgi:hypothetical protein